MRAAYALSKKVHHVERAQSVDGTLWTATGPGRPPPRLLGRRRDGCIRVLTRLGAPRIASIAAADDAPPMCAYHEADGLYVEIVSQAMRSVLLLSR